MKKYLGIFAAIVITACVVVGLQVKATYITNLSTNSGGAESFTIGSNYKTAVNSSTIGVDSGALYFRGGSYDADNPNTPFDEIFFLRADVISSSSKSFVVADAFGDIFAMHYSGQLDFLGGAGVGNQEIRSEDSLGNVNTIMSFTPDDNSVNYLDIFSGETGSGPGIVCTGSDANVDCTLETKGTGMLNFVSGSGTSTFSLGDTSQPGCIPMQDTDGAGITYITSLNGVLTASTDSCF
jgi:hypothetical protein